MGCGCTVSPTSSASAPISIASAYTSAFSDLPVICPVTPHDGSHVFHQYVIRVQRREDFVKFLHEEHVGTAIHYPLPIHRQPFWRAKGWNQGGLSTTDKLSSQIVSLPIDPFLSDEEQNKVIKISKKPRVIGLDTMNFWIGTKRKSLLQILKKIDILTINELELKLLGRKKSLSDCLKVLTNDLSIRFLIVKRGSGGSLLVTKNSFDWVWYCVSFLRNSKILV